MCRRILFFVQFFLLCGIVANAQTISGTIRDGKTNETVIGAVVSVKGSNTGTTTDIDGKFELPVEQNPPFIIVISIVGYESQEVNVSSLDKPLSVKLRSKEIELKGVEVTGVEFQKNKRSRRSQ